MRIFVSSAMGGEMEEFRLAAKTGAESLGHKVSWAEDFTASPTSSRGICLQAAREAEASLLLIGPRYGTPTDSGLSATEEEFNTAREAGRPILPFVISGKRDPEQEAFLARIREWRGGMTYQTCSTAMELQAEVVRALNGLAAGVDPAGAATQATEALQAVTYPHHSGISSGAPPRIAFAWSPVRTAFTISERLLFEEATGSLEEAFFAGPGRLCQQTPKLEVGSQFLSLSCRAQYGGEPEALGRIYLDGTVSAGVGIPPSDGSAFGFLNISPSETERALRQLLLFMGRALECLDPERVMQSGMGQSSLSNLGMGQFAEASPTGDGTIPMDAVLGGDRTRLLPAEPEQVGRHDLNSEADLASRIVSRLRRPQ